jgi:MFS family permease
VLGPLTAHADLGGARSWGLITAAYAVGAVAGGLVMTRYRPQRLLVAGMLSVPAYSLLLFALAVPLSVPLDLGAALAAGGSLEVFTVCWATTLQQEIPPDKLSRIVSYDALGGVALAPVATAVAGPAAAAFGTTAVLTVAGALVATLPVLVLLTPEVRHIHRKDPIPSQDGCRLEPAAPARVPAGVLSRLRSAPSPVASPTSLAEDATARPLPPRRVKRRSQSRPKTGRTSGTKP